MSLCKLVDLCCYLPERDGVRRVQGVGSESRVYVWFLTRATWDGYFFLWYVVDTTTICCWFKVAISNLLNFPAGYFDIFFCAAKQLKLTNVGGSLKVWLREWRGEIWWCGSQGNGGEAPGNHHCHELLVATVDGRKPAPADNGILTISTYAGFFPSTVFYEWTETPTRHSIEILDGD